MVAFIGHSGQAGASGHYDGCEKMFALQSKLIRDETGVKPSSLSLLPTPWEKGNGQIDK